MLYRINGDVVCDDCFDRYMELHRTNPQYKTEWIEDMKAYRIYNSQTPQQTIAYDNRSLEAITKDLKNDFCSSARTEGLEIG